MVAPNNRVFYACEAIAIGQVGDPNLINPDLYNPLEFVHGVQSVGINTSFNLEQAFELGQIAIYENIENLPEVEVTIEKVIDGHPLVYHMATSGSPGANPLTGAGFDLITRTKRRANVAMAIGSDENSAISGVGSPGQPRVEIFMSGMFVNSLNYTFPTDGFATESVTLTGNHRRWGALTPFEDGVGPLSNGLRAGGLTGQVGFTAGTVNLMRPPGFSLWNQDYPRASGGIARREDVLMESSIMPRSIFGVSPLNPTNPIGNNWDQLRKMPRAHISSITISADLGREDILELGRKSPYYKSVTFPIEVSSEFEVITVSGDFVNFYEEKQSTPEQPIKVVLRDGTTFDLGNKNRLSSINYGGGDTGGGNLTITYSFTTQNELRITPATVFDPPRQQINP
jgi:hypothetical protein